MEVKFSNKNAVSVGISKPFLGKLSKKLMLWFLTMAMIPLCLVGYFIFQSSIDVLSHQAQSRLGSVVELKNEFMKTVVNQYVNDLEFLTENENTGKLLSELLQVYQGNRNNIKSFRWEMVIEEFSTPLKTFRQNRGYSDLLLLDLKSTLLFSTHDETELGRPFITTANQDSFFSQAFIKAVNTGHPIFTDFEKNENNQIQAFLFQIVTDELGDKIGVIAIPFPYHQLSKIILEQLNMGKTQDTYLVGSDKKMRTPSRFSGYDEVLKQLVDTQASRAWLNSLDNAGNEKQKTIKIDVYQDYRGIEVLGSWSTLQIADKSLAIINEVDWSEVREPVTQMRNLLIITGLITFVVVLLVVMLVSHSISKPLTNSVADISSSSSQINATMTQQSSISQSLTTSITEITSTITQLDATAKNNTQQAESIIQETNQGKQLAETGNQKVENTVTDLNNIKDEMTGLTTEIDALNEQTQEISKITYMVLDLADQTRMLSLNAAVEAIRSGEHGVGFNVVAREIRALSDESKSSAEQIRKLLLSIQKSTEKTVNSTTNSVKSMKKSVDTATELKETFNNMATTYIATANNLEQIVLNIKQETQSIKQIYEAMKSIQQGQSENTKGYEQIQDSINNLGQVAMRLKQIV